MNCPKCRNPVQQDWLACPYCKTRLSGQDYCQQCEAELQSSWKICPFCMTEVQRPLDNGVDLAFFGYCASSGIVILQEDRHFSCLQCNQLYLMKFQFENKPICQDCASAIGIVDILKNERTSRKESLIDVIDCLSVMRSLSLKEKRAEQAGDLYKVAEIRYGEKPKWTEYFFELLVKLNSLDRYLFSEKDFDLNKRVTGEKRDLIVAEQDLEEPGDYLVKQGLLGGNTEHNLQHVTLEEKSWKNNKGHICTITGMEFVIVPEGEFQMGDVWGDGSNNEKPTRLVTIPAFQMAKYPVTRAQWLEVMGGENPAEPSGARFVHPDKPVINVSWDDAQEFIKRLNRKSGCNYRLPSEAEWEYAARSGGSRDKWSGTSSESSLSAYAHFNQNFLKGSPQVVGKKRPNDLDLYDMSGNVWEWCEDIWHDNYQGAPSNGSAWTLGGDSSLRVSRGGSWLDPSGCCRVAFRDWNVQGHRSNYFGFRLSQDSR